MTHSISIQHRIGEINYYRFNCKPGLDDNFSIRLAHKLADAGNLDLSKIKAIVNKLDTSFFRTHQFGGKNINRNEYAQALYDDLKGCELLTSPPEMPKSEQIFKMALFEIMEATNVKQARSIARKALRQWM